MSDDPVEEIKRQKLEQLQSTTEEPTTPDESIELESSEHFNELLDTHTVVLVDCYADWCGPCKQQAPIVDQVAAETDAAVVTVDIDRHRDLAQEWSVRGVPTLLIFASGELVERFTGVQPYDTLTTTLQAYLSK